MSSLPIVDENSKGSEESVLAIKGWFSKRNGFISREETPDYGCDLDVELIVNGDSASSKKFPIQIKSSAEFDVVTIDSRTFLTQRFKPSAINYLTNRSPAYGLIVLFDDANKVCYYDYVEEVVSRIGNERGCTEDWKVQKSVTVHVPLANIVSVESINQIHSKFLDRFTAHEELLKMHGKDFKIPHFNSSGDSSQTKLTAIGLLKKYGLLLLNDHDIAPLYKLLSDAPFQEINNSRELVFIACVVYAEMGKCVEAEFYFSKARQFNKDFDQWEVEILKFSRIKVDFLLGKRSREEYLADLNSIKEAAQSANSKLQLEINLFYYSVLEEIDKNEFEKPIEKDRLSLFSSIEAADLTENRKWLFKIYQAENLHMYISSWMLKKVSQIRIRESIHQPVSQEERVHIHTTANDIVNYTTRIVLNALAFAKNENDELIQAHGHYALGRFYLIREFDYFLLKFKNVHSDLEENFRRAFVQSIKAHDLFLGLQLLKEARLALINAYDLSRLALLHYDLNITSENSTPEKLLESLDVSQVELGIPEAFNSVIDVAYKQWSEIETMSAEYEASKLSDDDIERHSRVLLREYNLPDDRLANIINEGKSLRLFYSRCDHAKYELLADLRHLGSYHTKYARPISFIIRSKQTGLESLHSTDVEKLIEAFGCAR